jgi:hypothetical protein
MLTLVYPETIFVTHIFKNHIKKPITKSYYWGYSSRGLPQSLGLEPHQCKMKTTTKNK